MYKYDAFISYVHEDNSDKDNFFKQLESKNYKIWYDKDKLKVGDEWKKKLKTAINNSLSFIPVITKNYCIDKPNEFNWTKYELCSAHHLDIKIIPLKRKSCEEIQKNEHIENILNEIQFSDCSKNNCDETINEITNTIDNYKNELDQNNTNKKMDIFKTNEIFVQQIKLLYNRDGYTVQEYNKLRTKNDEIIKGDFIMTRYLDGLKEEEVIVKCYDYPLIDNDLNLLIKLIESVNNDPMYKLHIYILKKFYVNILESDINNFFKNSSKLYKIYYYYEILNNFFDFNNYLIRLELEELLKESNPNLIYDKLIPDNNKNYNIIKNWYNETKSSRLIVLDNKTNFIGALTKHMKINFEKKPHYYPIPLYINCENYNNNYDIDNMIKDVAQIKNCFYDLSKQKQMVFIFNCLNSFLDEASLKKLLIKIVNYEKAYKIIICCQKDYGIIQEFNNSNQNEFEKKISEPIIKYKCHIIDLKTD